MAFVSDDSFPSSSKRIKLDIVNDMDPVAIPDLPISNDDSNIIAHDGPGKRIQLDESYGMSSLSFSETDRPTDGTDPDGEFADEEDNDEVEEEEEDDDDGDDDDGSSTVSYGSELNEVKWKSDVVDWIEKQMFIGVNPRYVYNKLIGSKIPEFESEYELWKLIFSYLTDVISEHPKRDRLAKVYKLEDVVQLLKVCSKIIVLTGAGVSVSCGIPDFRSKDGVYARLAIDFPNLPDPQAMFDINYFRQDPKPFFKFAREIYPGQFKPSPCHRFIKMLEKQRKLLRNYTQNIDTLEKVAGIQNVVECHGSFATATCTVCSCTVTCEEIKEEVFNQCIPYCKKCHSAEDQRKDNTTEETAAETPPVIPPEQGAAVTSSPIKLKTGPPKFGRGIMKPDIVFFGEGLPESFHDAMSFDKDSCDLLIVIGSSLKVHPVALIPNSLPPDVPQILINRERLPHMNFDVELLGDSDVIVDHLCRVLGEEWEEICWRDTPLIDCTESLPVNFKGGSDILSSEEENEETEVAGNEQPVKCQRIGRRHVAGDDENARHISLDSSRDSGIGESSNSSNDCQSQSSSKDQDGNCFYNLRKRRYIFPGAEVIGLPSYLPNSNTAPSNE